MAAEIPTVKPDVLIMVGPNNKPLTLTCFHYLPYLAHLIWNWHPQKGWFPLESNLGPLGHQALAHLCQAMLPAGIFSYVFIQSVA